MSIWILSRVAHPDSLDDLTDTANMALVLSWIRAAVGPSPVEDDLATEVYRRISQECPRWLMTRPIRERLKSLTVITVLAYHRTLSA